MPSEARDDFKSALRFRALTSLFDPVVALSTRERAFKSRVVELAGLEAGEAALDLGCGTGTLAVRVLAANPECEVVGLDADPVVLRRARSKAAAAGLQATFQQGFSTELPYSDGQFDVVLSTLFFHHLEDVDKRRTAAEVLRVLRPAGRLVVADLGRPQDPFMRVGVMLTVQLLDGFSTTSANVAGALPGLLSSAGFSGVAVSDRLRTPIGTLEIVTARAPGRVQG